MRDMWDVWDAPGDRDLDVVLTGAEQAELDAAAAVHASAPPFDLPEIRAT